MAERIESESTVLRLQSSLGSLAAGLLGIATFLSLLVARFAAPYGERLPLFLALLCANLLQVAIIYFYAQRHRGAQTTQQVYDLSALRQQHLAEIERVMQTLDQTRRQLDALVLDNDELRARMAEHRDPAELLDPSIESALAASRDVLIHLTADGVVRSLNQAATQLLHITLPTARGKQLRNVARLFDADKDPARQRHADEMVLRAVQSHTTPQKIARAVLSAGPDDEMPVSVTVAPILNSSAFLEGAVIRIEPEKKLQVETTLTMAAPTPEFTKTVAIDPLTGLPDVHAFDARLAELLQIARLTHVSHTLLLLTIDDLETVHRQYGPAAGEEMLRKISELVLTTITPVGDAFRISLYTFAALIPDMSGDPARHVAETLRSDIAGCVIQKGDRQFSTTASLALEELNEGTEGADAALEHAQSILLEASIAGGNRVIAFQRNESRETTRRDDQEWISWLTPRFERQQIHLVSQSIVPSTRNEGTAKPWVEVFVRVEEDDGHWLPPGAYLPALRRNRLTGKLDLWVLQQCLNAVQTNRELFEKYAGININLDSATVVSDEFREQAVALLAESPVSGSQICFEIEESCVANHTLKVVNLIEAMAPHGTHFLLDHCRGSATIGLLRKVPVEYVKFHESLVRRAMSDPLDRAELEWLVQAAHLLNRKAVASHVENKELRELMSKIGIDFMQGLAIDQLGPLLI